MDRPLRTTVIGSYPFPGWLEFAARTSTGSARPTSPRCRTTRSIVAMHDQVAAGLDVITDGEQTRLDFNLSFYGYLEGHRAGGRAAAAVRAARRTTSAASTRSTGELRAPRGLGAVEEFERLQAARAAARGRR